MGSDFEMIEGKQIRRLRNNNQGKRGENYNLGCKEKVKNIKSGE